MPPVHVSPLTSPSSTASVTSGPPGVLGFDPVSWINAWLTGLIHAAYQTVLVPTLRAVAPLLLSTPQFEKEPHIVTLWHHSWMIALSLYLLFWLGGALRIMAGPVLSVPEPTSAALGRLLLAPVLSATSLTLIARITDLSNAIAGAVARQAVADPSGVLAGQGLPAAQLEQFPLFVVFLTMAVVLLVLILIARILLLVLATVMAPLVLMGHALATTDPVARQWWRFVVALFVIPILEALLLGVGAIAEQTSSGGLFGVPGLGFPFLSLLLLALLLLMAAIPLTVILRVSHTTLPVIVPLVRILGRSVIPRNG